MKLKVHNSLSLRDYATHFLLNGVFVCVSHIGNHSLAWLNPGRFYSVGSREDVNYNFSIIIGEEEIESFVIGDWKEFEDYEN